MGLTDTPLTDAFYREHPIDEYELPQIHHGDVEAWLGFARQLERELAAERGKNVAPQPSTANTAITAAPSQEGVGQGEVAGVAPGKIDNGLMYPFPVEDGAAPDYEPHVVDGHIVGHTLKNCPPVSAARGWPEEPKWMNKDSFDTVLVGAARKHVQDVRAHAEALQSKLSAAYAAVRDADGIPGNWSRNDAYESWRKKHKATIAAAGEGK